MKGSFVDKIAYLLNERQISKTQFAKDLGLNKNQYHRWELGMVPQSRTVKMIADYFMVVPASLIDPDRDIEHTFVEKATDDLYTFLPLSEQEKSLLAMYRDVSAQTQMRMIQALMNLYDKENEL